jgi:hypothetical protein
LNKLGGLKHGSNTCMLELWNTASLSNILTQIFLILNQDSVEENAFLNLLATDGTLRHAVPTHLACTMSTEEDHVLETVQTYRTHGLFLDVLQLLL